MRDYLEKVSELLERNIPFVQVTVVETSGSVPQNAGSRMLVTQEGWFWGTVGGGKVEKRAIEEAQNLISGHQEGCGPTRTLLVSWSLNRDIGMTCGGSVKFYFEAQNLGDWHIAVFGAGHVGQAVVELLSKLNCRVTCLDSREDWLNRMPDSPNLKKLLTPDLASAVASLPKDSFVTLVTMGHATDSPVLIEILRGWQENPFPYLGVIGSKAKAIRLKQDIEEAGLPEGLKDVFRCPMGLDLGSNSPKEIAISIVAQLLAVRDGKEI
ncbi:MAG: xanthine dehydrogenase accessory protein XdhC [Cyanobacteriota/Melainabacteria group bacterium]|nr:xanthine dehydrogenase accessory protein XdhC [Cyanobacteria bacterium HKST-UBA01]MCB9467328.1 xanthine dehydrogenase accessory protein XdhC [Candidatus Obscuribacterales bacterium]